MDIQTLIERVQKGESVKSLADSLGVSRDNLRKKFNKEGYFYNNKTKKYEKEVVKDEVFSVFTDEEIKFLKDFSNIFINQETYDIPFLRSVLPARKPEKKTPYIISEKTYEQFRSFSEEFENKLRITQNELVEIALREFMRNRI